MIVDDVHYDPVTLEGGSTFEIPVVAFDEPLTVIGDTTAMSQPHEVEYTFTFDSESAIVVEEAMDAAEDIADDATEVEEKDADNAAQAVEEVAEDESEAAEEVAEDASEAAEEAAEGIEEDAEEAAEAAAEAAEDISEAEESALEDANQAAADEVAALIDAIYVQERTEDTDAQIAAAKAAWDALTDEQKELVEGEEADPDYFGRDTGDASLDDPRNQDDIGEKELLVVSFGTSFNESRAEDIKGIEDALAAAYTDWSVRRAFTAQIIINHVQARDGEAIDNMDQALDRAVANGVTTLVVQPTHLMHGAEYDEMCEALEEYAEQIETIIVAEPLLGQVGSDATVINEDKKIVAEAITAEAVTASGYDSLEAAAEDGTAFVFMGHGTAHTAKVSYSQMATQMAELGYENVYIGTVEGEPEETACEVLIEKVQEEGYTKVILRPLMVVAGDHANNDMAGDEEDSHKVILEKMGFKVEAKLQGLGENKRIRDIFVERANEAWDALVK